ncbi:MAG: TonB-dependent receptor [Chitinophagales bacterium]|nr:TonB-dependent receptor [Chitinophagales bacterium]
MKSIFCFLLFLPFVVSAQNIYKVTGKVTDYETGEELIGVNIFIDGKKLSGTVSDFDGNYSIKVAKADTLVFRYVGYKDEKFMIDVDKVLNVRLQSENIELNTVVVSGSRKQEKILETPSSISVVGAETIKNRVASNAMDFLKDVTGVHINKSGIQGGTPSVRGFNGYFSNDLMTLVDNRIASLPSLRLNSFNMIPTDNDDINRIEVVRGPASALYGPNAVSGVVHIITKSPIDEPETTISVGLGVRSYISDTLPNKNNPYPRFDEKDITERTIRTFAFRHADTIRTTKKRGVKMGYKVSTKVFKGLDWKYSEPSEPVKIIRSLPSTSGPKYLLRDGSIDPKNKGEEVNNVRDEHISKVSVDGRMDFRFKKDLDLILSGGFNTYSGVDMTPIGAMQNRGWKYYYAQTRIMWKKLFAQVYMNGNQARDSYYVPTGSMFKDKSKFYALQLQHTTDIGKKLNLIYGTDAFFYNPNSEHTLNGRYEESDNIQEAGAYLQAKYQIHPRLEILAASRMDYGTQLEKISISPRAAFIFKPGTGQNLRFVFNKAYKTAGPAAYYIDAEQATIPVDIPVRVLGTPNSGFQYSFNNNPYYDHQL